MSTKYKEYKVHPLAAALPMVAANELQELADNLKENGQRIKGVVKDDLLIDGRNRQAACKIADIPFEVEQWDEKKHGKSVAAYITSINVNRRHLTAAQKATFAADAIPFFQEEAKERQKQSPGRGNTGATLNAESKGAASDIAAKEAGVSGKSVRNAARLKKEDPKAFKEVKAGKKSLNSAVSKLEKKAPKVAAPKPNLQAKFETACKSIGRVAGTAFASALLSGARLNQADTIRLADLDNEEISRIKPLLDINPTWNLARALKYKSETITAKHDIQDVLNACAAKGGSLEFVVHGFNFKVKKQ